jgi:lysophospholipase L1-like esterase
MSLHMRTKTSPKLYACSVALLAFAVAPAPLASAAKDKPDANHWVATWAVSPSAPGADTEMRRRKMEFDNQTVRLITHISLGGEHFRVRLSNYYGAKPVAIGEAHLALRGADAKIQPGSDRPLTFSGKTAVSIPPGGLVLSDPVDLKAPNAADLAISLFMPPGAVIASTIHYSAQQTSYVAAGNICGAEDLPDPVKISSWPYLVGVDVMAPAAFGTIVTLGDSITDGSRSTSDANRRWPDIMAARLLAQKGNKFAVVNAGIGGNRIMSDTNNVSYGPNALARFDRDVLSTPGLKYVFLFEGVNDIGSSSAEDIIFGMKQLIGRAHEHGVKIVGATIMPLRTQPAGQAKRQAVNDWIRTSKAFDGFVDFDKTISDPAQPGVFQKVYDSGDNLHPNDAGHKAMGDAVDLALFK